MGLWEILPSIWAFRSLVFAILWHLYLIFFWKSCQFFKASQYAVLAKSWLLVDFLTLELFPESLDNFAGHCVSAEVIACLIHFVVLLNIEEVLLYFGFCIKIVDASLLKKWHFAKDSFFDCLSVRQKYEYFYDYFFPFFSEKLKLCHSLIFIFTFARTFILLELLEIHCFWYSFLFCWKC